MAFSNKKNRHKIAGLIFGLFGLPDEVFEPSSRCFDQQKWFRGRLIAQTKAYTNED